MEGNGDAAAAEHHDDASSPRSDDLKIHDEDDPGQSPSLRQSGGDTASPRSASAREKKDGSAGGLRGGGRRLFDIIQQVQHANRANGDEDGNSGNSRWKSIRDRFRRAGTAMTAVASGQTQPVSDPELVSPKKNPVLARTMTRSHSLRNQNANAYPISDPEFVSSRGNSTRNRPVSISVSVRNSEPSAAFPSVCNPPPEENSGGGGGGGEGGGEGGHERRSSGDHKADFSPPAEQQQEAAPAMSLMALLEQADSWGGSEKDEEEDDEEDEVREDAAAEEDGEDGGDGMLYECCVCMVRHKGAAFIPCGHTFCRLCSRELRVSRGNCPLCTGFILEILDVF